MTISLSNRNTGMTRNSGERERIAARRRQISQGRVPQAVRLESFYLGVPDRTGVLILCGPPFQMRGSVLGGKYPTFDWRALCFMTGFQRREDAGYKWEYTACSPRFPVSYLQQSTTVV